MTFDDLLLLKVFDTISSVQVLQFTAPQSLTESDWLIMVSLSCVTSSFIFPPGSCIDQSLMLSQHSNKATGI